MYKKPVVKPVQYQGTLLILESTKWNRNKEKS